MKPHKGLAYWTADEVAECLPIPRELSSKLWGILSECKNRTPLGGDGSNGTVETPDGRLDEDNDDKCPHWWDRLTEEEQQAINTAYMSDMGDLLEFMGGDAE